MDRYPLRIVRTVLFFLWIAAFFSLSVGSLHADDEKLPFAAGESVRKALDMVNRGKLQEAINTLEAFKKEGKGASKEVAQKKGYGHYYIDYIQGNAYLMLAGGDGGKSRAGKARNNANVPDAEKMAAACYERALSKKPDLAEAWLNLAGCRYHLGEMRKAGDAFIKGHDFSDKKTRKSSQLYYGAMSYFQSGSKDDFKKSKDIFARLFSVYRGEVSGQWIESYIALLSSLNESRSALPYMEKLADMSSGSKKIQWQEQLLYNYLSLNMDEKALGLAEKLCSTEPLEPRWWKAVAHIHLQKNQLEDGLRAMVIYSYLKPLTREENSLIADLYLSLDIPSEAAIYYEATLAVRFEREIAVRLIHAYQYFEPGKALTLIDRVIAHDGGRRADRRLVEQRDMIRSKLLRSKGDNLING